MTIMKEHCDTEGVAGIYSFFNYELLQFPWSEDSHTILLAV